MRPASHLLYMRTSEKEIHDIVLFLTVSACGAEKGRMPAFVSGRLGTVNESASLRDHSSPLSVLTPYKDGVMFSLRRA